MISIIVTVGLVILTTILLGLFYYRSLMGVPKAPVALVFKNRNALPTLLSRIPWILMGAIWKKQGRFFSGYKTVPEVHFEIGATELGDQHLSRYNAVCGVPAPATGETKILPPCYPVMAVFLFQPLLVSLPYFPVSPLGLVHIRTVLVQTVELRVGVTLSYKVKVAGHRQTEKGIEIDFVIEARNSNGDLVWECIETMLSRSGSGGSKKRPTNEAEAASPSWDGSVNISIPENTGRKYAAVTGDYNPHHLYKATAALVGFKRAIAHGQWSLEYCLSQLQIAGIKPRAPFKVDCSFKLPVFLPGKALVRWNTTGAPNHAKVQFEMRSADGVLPHLSGRLENLDKAVSLQSE